MEEAFYRAEPSLAQLLTGIVNDAKALVRHELALATYEIREDLRKTKRAALSLGIGIGLAALGGLLLILMLVHLLHALAGLPLWACYGIVGGLLAVSGGVMVFIGKNTIARIDVVPPYTVETMKENVQWIKERVTSDGTSKSGGLR
jgi:Putative Actinobacterial Holin-X, holin superfamily III